MPWFVLSNGRIVGGGVQTISEEWQTPNFPPGEWACWRALIRSLPGPEKGRGALSEVRYLTSILALPLRKGWFTLPAPSVKVQTELWKRETISVCSAAIRMVSEA
jgi:hypothetical protein